MKIRRTCKRPAHHPAVPFTQPAPPCRPAVHCWRASTPHWEAPHRRPAAQQVAFAAPPRAPQWPRRQAGQLLCPHPAAPALPSGCSRPEVPQPRPPGPTVPCSAAVVVGQGKWWERNLGTGNAGLCRSPTSRHCVPCWAKPCHVPCPAPYQAHLHCCLRILHLRRHLPAAGCSQQGVISPSQLPPHAGQLPRLGRQLRHARLLQLQLRKHLGGGGAGVHKRARLQQEWRRRRDM